MTSDEEPDPTLATTEEECRGTIPGSNEATAMALAGQQAIANPVVERSKPRKVKKTASSTSRGHASTQTALQQPTMKHLLNNMSGIFTRLKDNNSNNNRNNSNNRPPDNPRLSITR